MSNQTTKTALTAAAIVTLGIALGIALVLVATVKLIQLLITAMNRQKLAKRQLAPAKPITGQTFDLAVVDDKLPIITVEVAPELPKTSVVVEVLPPIAEISDLETLRQIAKSAKVKGWASYKKAESLKAKLQELGHI